MHKEDNVQIQAVVIVDCFNNEFSPISDDLSVALFPVANHPLIDYTLESLSLAGINETILFSTSHTDQLKQHIQKIIDDAVYWTVHMKVTIFSNENCKSYGDCLRDVYSKGVIKKTFILLDCNVISNLNLEAAIRNYDDTVRNDSGTVMTLLMQHANIEENQCRIYEDVLIGTNYNDRIVFYEKLDVHSKERRKVSVPLETFLENAYVSLVRNVRSSHIAICSPAVLSLFADNFDFQTKFDFINGLLMNIEIMGSTIYCEWLNDQQYAGAIDNWGTFEAVSLEIKRFWAYPIRPPLGLVNIRKSDTVVAKSAFIGSDTELHQSTIGVNVKIGKRTQISNCTIFPNCTIENDVELKDSIIGSNCTICSNAKLSRGCVLGAGVVVNSGVHIENCLIQSNSNENCKSSKMLGKRAYIIDFEDKEDIEKARYHRLYFNEIYGKTSDDSDEEGSSDDNLSQSDSLLPDDSKIFFTEVLDSLSRGFLETVPCENLILEINSSRYAYNINLQEVNFNVITAILELSFNEAKGSQYYMHFKRLLTYCTPLINNYIKFEDDMINALLAIEEISSSNERIDGKWVTFVLKWFYDNDHISEDAILAWYKNLKSDTEIYMFVKPFAEWLQEAEEETSSTESDS